MVFFSMRKAINIDHNGSNLTPTNISIQYHVFKTESSLVGEEESCISWPKVKKCQGKKFLFEGGEEAQQEPMLFFNMKEEILIRMVPS
jgi:hypothetical protein